MADALTFDIAGWTAVMVDDGSTEYAKTPGDRLQIFQQRGPPMLPAALTDLDELRRGLRDAFALIDGAVVSIDVVTIAGVPAVVELFKFAQPSAGHEYQGAIILPFRDFSYQFRVSCRDVVRVGEREAAVLAERPTWNPSDPYEGWYQDPYDPTVKAKLLRSRADDACWDERYPDHPASRARRYLGELRRSIRLAPQVLALPRFTGPALSAGPSASAAVDAPVEEQDSAGGPATDPEGEADAAELAGAPKWPWMTGLGYKVDGWTRLDDGTPATYSRPPGDLLRIDFYAGQPDLPCALEDLDGLRRGLRSKIGAGGGAIISIDVVEVAGGFPAVIAIFKFLKPKSTGMVYMGSILVPFRTVSFQFRVQCPGLGITGTREAVIMAHRPITNPANPLEGWSQDPYDPTLEGGLQRSLADDERWDAQFPDHPLSRLRRHLAELQRSIQVPPDMLTMPRFTGPVT